MTAPENPRFALEPYLDRQRARIDAALERWLPEPGARDPGRLCEAMRYAVLGGGKRLRPVVLLAAHAACGGADPPDEPTLRAAGAVELVHCYSLVHDDLPAMDDDDLRRGRPSLHRAFGEPTAILVGDALLTLAFEWVAAAGAEAVRTLAREAGHAGMIVGQARDLAAGGRTPELAELALLHDQKTGALFAAAAALGALCAHAEPGRAQALTALGLALGSAFQCADDRDDADHPSLQAAAGAHAAARLAEACAAVGGLGSPAAPLLALAAEISRRAAGPQE